MQKANDDLDDAIREVEEDKVVGVETITKKIVDFTILNKFEKFCYNHIVEKLSEVIPKNKIEKLY